MPSNPPERSVWRKQKLLLPALSDTDDYNSTASSTSYSLFQPSTRNRSSSSGGSSSNRSSSKGRRSRTTSSSNSGARSSTAEGVGDEEQRGAAGLGSTSSIDSQGSASTSSSSSSSNVPAGMRECRYWHEITRSHWHNRLGNLLLLQPTGREVCGAPATVACASQIVL